MNELNDITNRRILIIDDNPSIHEDIRRILAPRAKLSTAMADAKVFLFGEAPEKFVQAEFIIESAFQGEEGLHKVQQAAESGQPYALAFVDVRMPPGWDGLETITQIWKDHSDLQVVICTAYSDYSWQEMIEHLGMSDSLVILKKPFDKIEVLQLAHALTKKWSLNQQVHCRLQNLDELVNQRSAELRAANEKLKSEITERMQMEKALRLSEERFSKAFRASPIPLAIQSLRQQRFVDANHGFQALTGYGREQLVGHTPEEINLWGEADGGREPLKKLRSEMSVRNLPYRLRTQKGQLRDTLLSVELFELEGEPYLLIIAQDITEQIKLENQLRQAQKMEAVGQLAAGVAHDFNNILTVVQGHASVLLATRPPDSREGKSLQAINFAAERAGKLVRQLLTFSRKQVMQARSIEVSAVLAAVSDMLPRLLGEQVLMNVIAPKGLPSVYADAGMLEQMLINLAVNARDAMPEGGTLTIQAEAVQLGPDAARENPEARPGKFLRLSVTDTGCGIPPEVLPRIFEPFFTTKPVGKGTGLGLATVYGIAKQHQGWVEIQTQLGQGTTFKVLLPCPEKRTEAPALPFTTQVLKGGEETILVAEDEEDVRDFAVELLKSYGYKVYAAASGQQALERWAERQDEIKLLLTDMVMPGGMSGRQLAKQLLEQRPNLAVIYTSGYSPGSAGHELAEVQQSNFLGKPYGPSRLLNLVRECLDRAAAPNAAAAAKS
jgi:PAS domain S-box-containing protein